MGKLQRSDRPAIPQPSVSNQLSSPEVGKLSLDGAVQLIQFRPLLFWGGVWASVVLVTLVAVISLISPSSSGGPTESTAAINTTTTESPHSTPKQDNPISLWLFGAIALSCAASSVLISRQLSQPRRLTQPTHRSRRKAAKPKASTLPTPPKPQEKIKQSRRPKAQPSVQKPLQKPLYGYAQAQPSVQKPLQTPLYGYAQAQQQPIPIPVAQPLASEQPITQRATYKPMTQKATQKRKAQKTAVPAQKTAANRQRRTAQKVKPKAPMPSPMPAGAVSVPVTVVPRDENHPLDWQENSLADMFDLRKRRSLSSWL